MGNIQDTGEWQEIHGNLTSPTQEDGFLFDGTDMAVSSDTLPNPPGVPVTISPTNNNQPIWNWDGATDTTGIDHYIFYWDTVPGGEKYKSGNLYSASFTHVDSLTDGTWYGKVEAFDLDGNKVFGGNGSVIIDTVPPQVTISAPLPIIYQSSSLPVPAYLVIDNWDSSPSAVVSGWSNTEGQHTMTVTGTDKAGNIGNKSVTYTVQNLPSSKDQCKNNLWKLFGFLNFKNQGACTKFVEKNSSLPRNLFSGLFH